MPVIHGYNLRSKPIGNGDAMSPQASEIESDRRLHYKNLCASLDKDNLTYLLKNIHEADELEFFDEKLSSDYLQKELYIGKDHNVDIYARIQNTCRTHVVRYWSDSSAGAALEGDIGEKIIIHPFNKTYTTDTCTLATEDLERIDVLVTWYFIADGNAIAIDIPSYRERLVSTLVYIANRMGNAAAQPLPPPEVIQSSDKKEDIRLTKEINCIDERLEWLERCRDIAEERARILKTSGVDEELELEEQIFTDMWAMEQARILEISGAGEERKLLERSEGSFADRWELERARILETNGVDEKWDLLDIDKQILMDMWAREEAGILKKRAIFSEEREKAIQNKRRRNNDTRGVQGMEV
jgi:hypothetical protein